ncbi:hypothetical protein Scep_023777 [Stephania cephalantha]|uniref:Uncharacterized protein n=1 Tax=Stephania cephalantha TaxID=152367 RepID=A0AAP0HWJ8_9MAGN
MAFPFIAALEESEEHGGFFDHGAHGSSWARLESKNVVVLESCANRRISKLANQIDTLRNVEGVVKMKPP